LCKGPGSIEGMMMKEEAAKSGTAGMIDQDHNRVRLSAGEIVFGPL